MYTVLTLLFICPTSIIRLLSFLQVNQSNWNQSNSNNWRIIPVFSSISLLILYHSSRRHWQSHIPDKARSLEHFIHSLPNFHVMFYFHFMCILTLSSLLKNTVNLNLYFLTYKPLLIIFTFILSCIHSLLQLGIISFALKIFCDIYFGVNQEMLNYLFSLV